MIRPSDIHESPGELGERSQESSQGSPAPADHIPEEPARDNLSIFDERFALFMTQFGRTCEEQQVQLAIAVVVDPQQPDRPHVFCRGGLYDVASLTREVLANLRDQIIRSLS